MKYSNIYYMISILFGIICGFVIGILFYFILFYKDYHAPSSDSVKAKIFTINNKKYKLDTDIVLCGL